MDRRHRVVIVGAGFGGLAAAKGLRQSPVDVEIVDANNFHLFQPLLYQVATAGLDADDVAYAVRGVFRRQRNVNVQMAKVTAIDLDRRVVGVVRGTGVSDELSYDSLVLAAGAVSTTYGIAGIDEHAISLKSLDDALDLRLAVLQRFEEAAADPSMIERGELNVVVCGGGPTGVETSGAMMEFFTKVLAKDFPTLDVRSVRVILVEAAPRLLGALSEKSGERAMRTLAKRGVEVRVGVGVDRVVDEGERRVVHLADGTALPAGVVVWAAGVRASPLAESLGVELTKGGRIVVADDLSIPGHPEAFAIGDIAGTEPLLPQVAQPAIQGGRHAARQIARRLEGAATEAFHYRDKGSMATIGRHDAVAEFPSGRRLTGFAGWVAWLGLHLVYLIGFRNRANVLVNWAWNYLTFDRGSRIVAERDLAIDASPRRSLP
ncbi:NAD(P)/FAD-dependent oxidoreductase [Desertimonas flava]|uniref:NAD(P)/FAD-dependent oxidoreductase n=1 Tax=Desertimonas flava TaxID=2064846 RepID=UPI001D0BFD6B|nr:NAD(P)/FAD-dependent oxidoreductase [Desertimonas flava]